MTEPVILQQIRLRARRLVLWLRSQWAGDTSMGLSIGHDEIDRILSGSGNNTQRDAFYSSNATARALAPLIGAADSAVDSDERFQRVVDRFTLSPSEAQLLALAVALELDPWLRRVVAYLHDDATMLHATPWLAAQLFESEHSTAVGPSSRLVTWRLATPLEGSPIRWSALGPWVADFAMACWIAGDDSIDPSLGGTVSVVQPTKPIRCLYPQALEAMDEHARPLRSKAIEIAIVAPPGAGKRTLAAHLCYRLGCPLVVADIARATTPDAAVRVVRTARLLDGAVYWHDAEAVPQATWRVLEHAPLLSIVGTSGTNVRVLGDEAVRRTVTLPALRAADRVALWTALAPERRAPAPVTDFPLLPADIVRAASLAGASDAAIAAACRTTLPADAAALTTPLIRHIDDELVVPPSIQQHLDELVAQAQLRSEVAENWRFGRLSTSRGLTALFAGPSGTGKTMAACIIARKLGMDLYRVDLAGVVSKYIGETEKQLRRLFDACERANVVLFFDEADALFGKRTQVKDAHDRFANIEIDYLLQRMESFEGVSILATNRRNDLDNAFVRRLRFIIEFSAPTIEDRRKLWRTALAEPTPEQPRIGKLDFDALAERLDMTGADIKNAALGAAFLACNEGSEITMQHVVRAARRELAKRGVVVRAEDLLA